MSLRARALDALGLGPLWVRRTRLAEIEAANAAAVHDAPAAEAPAPGAAATATPVAEPTPAKRSMAPVVVVPTPASKAAAAAAAKPVIPIDDERAARIAALDWNGLQQEVAQCTACSLCQSRTQTVFGVGQPAADVLVVGEAPGAEEDKRGEPFVGAAGKLLDSMLAAVGEKRGEQVFIANVLKCRPPGNRNPTVEEVAHCAPLLRRQIELLQPKVIFASGRFAIQTLLETDAPVGALRGKVHQYKATPVVVSYHPAYLLRNLPDKAKAWRDLLLLQQEIRRHRAAG
ncbi:DNA polymerase [Andreprevotia lacus DSM 23236]|jgi:DNA polymerase|uniref:Type-4 uracil-DNA glycosylase n=1 Tax=Andreprevotia lacus DSM 23236 TaxID=1121001 RepID=A0A1W1XDB4_9NEIS|nr:uracil-DNA glycosylase [Andreprevotia lacus]SMC21794.1 DNA polymerase [Andreprevotia lacus DSM 23236]